MRRIHKGRIVEIVTSRRKVERILPQFLLCKCLSADWAIALCVNTLRANVRNVTHVFGDRYILLFNRILALSMAYSCVVIDIGCSIQILLRPIIELITTNSLALVFGFF